MPDQASTWRSVRTCWRTDSRIDVWTPGGDPHLDVFGRVAHCLAVWGKGEVQILVANKHKEHLRCVEVRPTQLLCQMDGRAAESREPQFADGFGNGVGILLTNWSRDVRIAT
jgi:hypothetical protein